MVKLFKLQQDGSISDYYLANKTKGLNEVMLNCFISGLNGDIKHDVIPFSHRIFYMQWH